MPYHSGSQPTFPGAATVSEYDSEDPPRRARRARRDDDSEDDRPAKPTNGLAVAALVLGLLSMPCLFFAGIPAIICGFLGLSKAKQTGVGYGVAMAGLLLGVFGTIVCTGVSGVGMYYSTFKVKEAAHRSTMVNNLKQTGLAMQNYHDTFAKLPPPDEQGSGGSSGLPADKRLSWRVTVLPYIEQGMIYSRFDRDSAWDSPKNKDFAKTKVKVYADPEPDSGPDTRIRVFVGPKAVFQPGTPNQLSLPTVRDGVSNTIFAVEAGDTVPWPQYKELPFDPNGPLPSLGRPNESGFLVVYLDGHVQFVKKNVDPKVLKGAITPAGGELPLLGEE